MATSDLERVVSTIICSPQPPFQRLCSALDQNGAVLTSHLVEHCLRVSLDPILSRVGPAHSRCQDFFLACKRFLNGLSIAARIRPPVAGSCSPLMFT